MGATYKLSYVQQPNSYAQLTDAIRKEISKIQSVNFNLLFDNDEGSTSC